MIKNMITQAAVQTDTSMQTILHFAALSHITKCAATRTYTVKNASCVSGGHVGADRRCHVDRHIRKVALPLTAA